MCDPTNVGPIGLAVFTFFFGCNQAKYIYIPNRLTGPIGGNREMDKLYTMYQASNVKYNIENEIFSYHLTFFLRLNKKV